MHLSTGVDGNLFDFELQGWQKIQIPPDLEGNFILLKLAFKIYLIYFFFKSSINSINMDIAIKYGFKYVKVYYPFIYELKKSYRQF